MPWRIGSHWVGSFAISCFDEVVYIEGGSILCIKQFVKAEIFVFFGVR